MIKEKYKSIRFQAIINMFGCLVYTIAIWLMTVITTQELGYEEVGNLTLAMAVGNVFFYIQTCGFRTFQCSDMAFKYAPSIYLKTRLVMSATGLLLCFITCLCFSYTIDTIVTVMLYLLLKTSEAISDAFYGDDQRFNRLDIAGESLCVRGIVILPLYYIGVHHWQSTITALLLSACFGFMLTACFDYPKYKQIIRAYNIHKTEGVKSLLVETFPLFMATLLPIVITALPRIMLEHYHGAVVLGFYGNISTPALLITILVPTLLTAILPHYGRLHLDQNRTGVLRIWLLSLAATVALTIICCLGVFILGKPVMSLLYTNKIIPYINYLYLIMISMMLFAFTSCNGAVLVATRSNKTLLSAVVVAALLCIITVRPLVQFFGILGAILVLAIAYLGQSFFQFRYIAYYCIDGKDIA